MVPWLHTGATDRLPPGLGDLGEHEAGTVESCSMGDHHNIIAVLSGSNGRGESGRGSLGAVSADHKMLMRRILNEVTLPNGEAATERFAGLRAVDAKVREARLVLKSIPGLRTSFLTELDTDQDFQANSRRVRLEALGNYLKTAIQLLDTEVLMPAKRIVDPPDLGIITGQHQDLQAVLKKRWLEAQRCVHAEAYLSAVVMMGSILEGLLLARALLSVDKAYQAKAAPKDKKTGKPLALPTWTLNSLLDVAIELSWVKKDRGAFGHALRQSRNIVHPWAHVTSGTDPDAGTAKTSWSVLVSAVEDLVESA